MTKLDDVMRSLPPTTRRLVIAVVGGAVLLVGAVMIPYPGPGWLVVFMGLGILAQEFAWARRALRYGRRKYTQWTAWAKHQHPSVQIVLAVFTVGVVVMTLWVLNGYGLLNSWLRLGQDWLNSPFIR